MTTNDATRRLEDLIEQYDAFLDGVGGLIQRGNYTIEEQERIHAQHRALADQIITVLWENASDDPLEQARVEVLVAILNYQVDGLSDETLRAAGVDPKTHRFEVWRELQKRGIEPPDAPGEYRPD